MARRLLLGFALVVGMGATSPLFAASCSRVAGRVVIGQAPVSQGSAKSAICMRGCAASLSDLSHVLGPSGKTWFIARYTFSGSACSSRRP